MQCSFIKGDKSRCRAKCISGDRFCFFHSPATRKEHHEATVAGGKERCRPAATFPPETPDLPLQSLADVTAALCETYNAVRTGRLAVNVGNCLALIAQALLKSIEGSDLERRLEALEGERAPRRRAG